MNALDEVLLDINQQCRVCLDFNASCKSLYESWQSCYLPHTIFYLAGIEIKSSKEPDAKICAICAKALIQAEIIVKKFRVSHETLLEKRQKKLLANEDHLNSSFAENDIANETEDESSKFFVNEHAIKRSYSDAEELSDNEDTQHSMNMHDNDETDDDDEDADNQPLFKLLDVKNSSDNVALNGNRKRKRFFFQCDLCNYESYKTTDARSHVLNVHGMEKARIFKCHLCAETYCENNSLLDHIAYFHEKRPRKHKYLCCECGKGFPKKSHLVRHTYVHNPHDRPFPCKYCELKFITEPNLKRHFDTVHSAKKDYVCKICNKSFGVVYSLKAHLKLHQTKPHRCLECDRNFQTTEALDVHTRICQKLKITTSRDKKSPSTTV